ncbi:MAG: hypothetical protein Q4A24_04995 [Akkermansia sp.]|nr:hypothetical protein [Akkermansia sp.]
MNLKSITFRCAEKQLERMESAMSSCSAGNRTELISSALENFLDYVSQDEVSRLNLFELVEHINAIGSALPFDEHA